MSRGPWLFGVESVPCPVCRAKEGRPCTNPRGYLVAGHALRLEAWMALETAEAETARLT